MYYVERHYIKGNSEIVRLCTLSKELYNRCNYLMRQAWINKTKLPNIVDLVKATQSLDCYKNLHNTKTAKQTIRQILTDWSNFKKALNAYYKDKSKFTSKPCPPKYKKKLAQVIFYNETILKKALKSGFITPTNECFFVKSDKKYKQVIITPKSFGFIIEVQYEAPDTLKPKFTQNICCIDLGINNLCTITSDKHSPILINGRIVKAINQWYNKYKNKHNTKKRYFRLENYFHHTSKFIIDNCIKNNIDTIVIGKNDGWKTRTRLGKKNNQNFQSIPFNNLLQKLQYKANAVGIDVIFTEESYTSKASFLDRDYLPIYDKNDTTIHKFSGTRVSRGLYRSSNGVLLNADCNGSANIGRKVFPNRLENAEWDRSVAATPVVINPLNVFYTTM